MTTAPDPIRERHTVPYVEANRRDVLTEHDLFRGEATDALVARAHEHIADLCTKRTTWRMAIPPSNHDSDMLLGEALTRLRDERDALRAALPEDPWVWDPNEDLRYCYACPSRPDKHRADCPWLLARAASPEQGL